MIGAIILAVLGLVIGYAVGALYTAHRILLSHAKAEVDGEEDDVLTVFKEKVKEYVELLKDAVKA